MPVTLGQLEQVDLTTPSSAIASAEGLAVASGLNSQRLNQIDLAVGKAVGAARGIGNFFGLNNPASGFVINEFLSNLTDNNDTVRTNHFNVFFTLPPLVAQSMTMRQLALQAEISELPGREMTPIEYRHYSFTKRVPHFNTYGHINFTFLCTGNLSEKMLFDRWMDIMVPSQTGLVMYPFDNNGNHNYDTTITINQYDQAGNLAYAVDLLEAMPLMVGPMGQTWSSEQVHKLQVTFAFTKWQSSQTQYNMITDFTVTPSATPGIQSGADNSNINNYTNINNPTLPSVGTNLQLGVPAPNLPIPTGHIIAPGVGATVGADGNLQI